MSKLCLLFRPNAAWTDGKNLSLIDEVAMIKWATWENIISQTSLVTYVFYSTFQLQVIIMWRTIEESLKKILRQILLLRNHLKVKRIPFVRTFLLPPWFTLLHFNQNFNWFAVSLQISEPLNEAPGISLGVNLISSILSCSILKLFRERFFIQFIFTARWREDGRALRPRFHGTSVFFPESAY